MILFYENKATLDNYSKSEPCFQTLGFDDHDPPLQVNEGLDQAEPGLLFLTQANAVVIHNHPASVIQQPLTS